ncbi:PREDICTED: uncharacterized protein LOC106807688 isoform X2 [Priapulus caudatus]|uniref:Uncharacterized protein LOC106807688 isoform X2 n=1 Tax=Priapulus caudatus TaxID=37621 RepID=A0ABM1E077_PRICU|nr:PREDICTED: uncharacterized protein LOC106807688 isoform X2 [Priapulus caudatus]
MSQPSLGQQGWSTGDQRRNYAVRVGAAGQYGAPTTPTHSTVYGDSHQPMYHTQSQTLPRAAKPEPRPQYQSPSFYAEQRRRRGGGGPHPLSQLHDVQRERAAERAAIERQPFRSKQLIMPSVKTTWDLPTGSYMKLWRNPESEVVNRDMGAGVQYGPPPPAAQHHAPPPPAAQHHAPTAPRHAVRSAPARQEAQRRDEPFSPTHDDKRMAESLRRSLTDASSSAPHYRPSGSQSSSTVAGRFYVPSDDSGARWSAQGQQPSPMNVYSTVTKSHSHGPGSHGSNYMASNRGGTSYQLAPNEAMASGALMVQESEPYVTKPVNELRSMYSQY